MFLDELYNSKNKSSMIENQIDDENSDVETTGAITGAGAGTALGTAQAAKAIKPTTIAKGARTIGSGFIKKGIPGMALGMGAGEALKYAKQGKYPQAAIAAGSGIVGSLGGPATSIAIPAVGDSINYCLDNPTDEECQFLKPKEERFDQSQIARELYHHRGILKDIGKIPIQQRSLEQQAAYEKSLRWAKNPNEQVKEVAAPNTSQSPSNDQNFDLLKQAVIDIESGGDPKAVSPKGAMGRMQVMPATARDPGYGIAPAKDFSQPELERVGTEYLKVLLNKYGGDKKLALMAYNMGPGATDAWIKRGGRMEDLPAETQAYVPKVLGRKAQYSGNEIATTPLSIRTTTPIQKTSSARRRFRNRADDVQPKSTQQNLPVGSLASIGGDEVDYRSSDFTEIDDEQTRQIKSMSKDKLLQLYRSMKRDPEMLRRMGSKIYNLVKTLLGADAKTAIAESFDTEELSELVYNELLNKYGDLVNLYGHEVVGDAIVEIILKHKIGDPIDVEKMSKKVLSNLRKRIEPEEEELEKTPVGSKDKNAMIQLQADIDKIKNTLGVKENKIYYNVLATNHEDLRNKFHLKLDSKGWFLYESDDASKKLDAARAFTIG